MDNLLEYETSDAHSQISSDKTIIETEDMSLS